MQTQHNTTHTHRSSSRAQRQQLDYFLKAHWQKKKKKCCKDMNAVMRISLLGSRTENLIKCACRWEGLNEILLLIISVYLINIHHTAETGYPASSYYHPFVCQSGRKIEIPAARAIVRNSSAARRTAGSCLQQVVLPPPPARRTSHIRKIKKSARFRRGEPNVPTALKSAILSPWHRSWTTFQPFFFWGKLHTSAYATSYF